MYRLTRIGTSQPQAEARSSFKRNGVGVFDRLYSYKPVIANSHKERFEEVIDSIFINNVEKKRNYMEMHFIFASYESFHYYDDIKSLIIREAMKKYKIKKVMMTGICMLRHHLITKEEMENYCKGKNNLKKWVNDDLDSMFESIRLGKQRDEIVKTDFFPMLTEAELKLVETKDYNYMQSFSNPNADIDEADMKLSGSDSKYIHGYCQRKTFIIENPSP